MFNDVLWKMVTDDDKQSKISRQADDYEMTEGVKIETERVLFFSGGAYGGLAYELQCLAKQIISLCCSASGCERNWSTFAFIHTKKRNCLEHKRLNGLVYISNNRKMSTGFQKLREQGSKGKKSNPLILEEFQWDNEWVDINVEPVHQGGDHITWVDEVIGASRGQRGRNHSRRACGDVVASGSSDRPIGLHITYARHSKLAASVDEVGHENEDAAKDDDFAVADVEIDNEDIESETPSTHAGGASRQEDEFELDDDLHS